MWREKAQSHLAEEKLLCEAAYRHLLPVCLALARRDLGYELLATWRRSWAKLDDRNRFTVESLDVR
jgi:hypothetical protein